MDIPFSEQLEALDDIVRWERHRIDLTHQLALTGQCQPPPDVAFRGWRERLERLEAATALVRELAAGRLVTTPGPAAAASVATAG